MCQTQAQPTHHSASEAVHLPNVHLSSFFSFLKFFSYLLSHTPINFDSLPLISIVLFQKKMMAMAASADRAPQAFMFIQMGVNQFLNQCARPSYHFPPTHLTSSQRLWHNSHPTHFSSSSIFLIQNLA